MCITRLEDSSESFKVPIYDGPSSLPLPFEPSMVRMSLPYHIPVSCALPCASNTIECSCHSPCASNTAIRPAIISPATSQHKRPLDHMNHTCPIISYSKPESRTPSTLGRRVRKSPHPQIMSNRRRWSWSSALIGAASASAAAAIIWSRPRDPTFHLISITLSSFHLNLPHLDVDLNLTVHVTNPNVVPVRYSAATVSIFYAGSRLGSAQLNAGSQPPMSCQLLRLPARLHALELAHHAPALLADAARREMALDASVDISGTAQVLWWARRFSIHVDSHVLVDPIFLEVIDQENHSDINLYLA